MINKKLLIGIGIGLFSGSLVYLLYYKPNRDRKKLIEIFIDKNYIASSQNLLPEEKEQISSALMNLSDDEQKILYKYYNDGIGKLNIDSIKGILDKLKPIIDTVIPVFEITKVDLGKKDINLYIKNAVDPDVLFNYKSTDGKDVSMDIPLNNGGNNILTLKYQKGKLLGIENGLVIQEKLIERPKEEIEKSNKKVNTKTKK